jgi:copper transport protein
MRSQPVKMLGVGLLVLLLTVLPAVPASAHANLVQSTPGDSSVVGKGPAEVTLRYDQPVSIAFGAVKVLAPDGSRVDTGQVTTSDGGRTVADSLHGNLATGTYTILWRVLSADSHSVFGASTFSVGKASASGAASAAAAEQAGEGLAAEDLLDVSRLVMYLGLLVLLGALAFLFILWPGGHGVRGVRRMLWSSWALAFVGSAFSLLLQGPYSMGLPLIYAFDPELIVRVLRTPYGMATAARLILLVAAGVVLLRLGRVRPGILAAASAVVGVGLLFSTSVIGHAGDGELTFIGLPADVLHLAAGSAWVGGLVVLATAALRRTPPADLPALMPRWSRYAEVAVLVLVITGTFAGWRQVRELGALTDTAYGRLLLIKVGLVVVMLALGAVARSRVRRHYLSPVQQSPAKPADDVLVSAGGGPINAEVNADLTSQVIVGQSGAGVTTLDRPAPVPGRAGAGVARSLRRSVFFEAGIAVIVLAVTAVLVSTPPAKDRYFPVFRQASSVSAGLSVQVEVDPTRVGLNDMHLYYTDDGGKPVDVVASSARWTLQGGDDVVPVVLGRTSAGHYDLTRIELSTAGTWQLAITTQTSDIDSHVSLLTVRVR